MKALLALAVAFAFAFAAFCAAAAPPQDSAAGEQRFRALYKELVETNTTLSAGSCTLAAERMAARLKAAGFPDGDLHPFAAPDHPKEGGLVAIYPGRDPQLKAILLLAHIDVVEAKREDWTRDPFTLANSSTPRSRSMKALGESSTRTGAESPMMSRRERSFRRTFGSR
jgi:hypothetical protein